MTSTTPDHLITRATALPSQPRRVAALYDIHGNLPALDAALADIARTGVDEIVVGGDVVPGPMPRETLDRLAAVDVPVRYIRGNGENDVLTVLGGVEPVRVPKQFRDVVTWSAEQLSDAHRAAITAWPDTLTLNVAGLGRVLFCHATPTSDTTIFTRRTSDERLTQLFQGVDADLVVCGHTHMQLNRTAGRLRIVNAGSIGMPFGPPGAHWLTLGPGIELRRTDYDLESTATKIRQTSYPGAAAFADQNILQPPSETMMLDAFDRV